MLEARRGGLAIDLSLNKSAPRCRALCRAGGNASSLPFPCSVGVCACEFMRRLAALASLAHVITRPDALTRIERKHPPIHMDRPRSTLTAGTSERRFESSAGRPTCCFAGCQPASCPHVSALQLTPHCTLSSNFSQTLSIRRARTPALAGPPGASNLQSQYFVGFALSAASIC